MSNFHTYINTIISELETTITEINETEIETMLDYILKAKTIYCDGLGRSGLVSNSFATRLSQMNFSSVVVSGHTTTAITDKDILIIGSGSGETPSLILHAKRALQIGAKVILITTNPHSKLGDISDLILSIPAQSKNSINNSSIQPMGTLFEQSMGILFDALILMIMERKHITVEQMYKKHNNLE